MTTAAWLIIAHQLLFQGMFFAKNIALGRKLDQPIRGYNREANLAIVFFMFYIGVSLGLALNGGNPGYLAVLPHGIALAAALSLMAANTLIGLASLRDLGDSWRVGVIEEQQTALIEDGIYRHSRNPYFVSYLLMFAAYTVLLQNGILLVFSVLGFALVHVMVRKEEAYLHRLHGETYRAYQRRVPRYLGNSLRLGKGSTGEG